jgi:2-oxoglutarate ferredoxin oxidoreductase subunit gamma
MSQNLNIILSGFGGQGLLFAGKLIANAGLVEGREISWLPSYGPEMRGGTANCSVCLSDEPIGSPLVTEPDALIAMNQPSAEKFVPKMVSGGIVLVDSTMTAEVPTRDDVTIIAIPATQLAEENGLHGGANIILTGKLWKERPFCERATLDKALEKTVPAKHKNLLGNNIKALEIGMSL